MLYYTYIHRRSDTAEVFYVGKGQRRRAYSSCNRNKQWRVITQEIDYIVEIFEYFEKEQDAFSLERYLISTYCNLGVILVNKTSGGQGISGHKHSFATRDKIRIALNNPDVKFRQKRGIAEAYANPETRKRMADAVRHAKK